MSLKNMRTPHAFGFLLAWIFLWFFPWGKWFPEPPTLYLVFLLDMSRLLVALAAFLLPGIFLYFLVAHPTDWLVHRSGIIPVGFAFSVFLVGLIGLIGRIGGFSFLMVKTLFALSGAAAFILLMIMRSRLQDNPGHSDVIRSGGPGLSQSLPLLFVLLLSLLLTFHDKLLFIDDLTYMAYLTNWQHSSQLGFINLVHGSGIVEIERFWLSLYPMGQALLADLSGVPGILLTTNYLELYLVPIAVLASHWFGRELGLSRKAATISVLIQLALFSWMVGEEWPVGKWFFESMGEDKVSAVFHLAPVFFVFILKYINRPLRSNLFLIILSGVALILTHPVILFFACGIGLGLGALSWFSGKSNWVTLPVLGATCVAFMLPFLLIKTINYSSQVGFATDTTTLSATYQVERYTNIISDLFYGVNPGVYLFFDIPRESSFYQLYQFVRVLPALLCMLAGGISLIRWRQGPLYWYILVCMFLITIATIPYTGWILGYLVDARLLSRVSWFLPVGFSAVWLLKFIDEKLKRATAFDALRRSTSYAMLKGYFLWFLLSFIFISPVLFFRLLPQAPKYFAILDHNSQLAEIGAYIDRTSSEPVTAIALHYTDTQLLPAVSARVRLISFREEMDYNGFNNFMPLEEVHERIESSNLIRSLETDIPAGRRCSQIEQFDVRFVISSFEEAETYREMLSNCGTVAVVFSTRDLVLMEIR